MFYAIPAYGHKFKNVDELRQAWEAGKDFMLKEGPYFSIRDFHSMKQEAYLDRALYGEAFVICFRYNTPDGVNQAYVTFAGDIIQVS